MSKLDGFLVSPNLFSFWKDSLIQVLPRSVSNRCPILLKVEDINFGPKPFRFFDSWMNFEGLQEVVSLSWSSNSVCGTPDFILKEKLKALKKDLKVWSKQELEKKR